MRPEFIQLLHTIALIDFLASLLFLHLGWLLARLFPAHMQTDVVKLSLLISSVFAVVSIAAAELSRLA